MNWSSVLAAAILVGGAVYVVERVAPQDKQRVEVKTVYQDRVLPGVDRAVYRTLTNYVTNTTELSNLVTRMQELDKYRTLPGWIATSNDRIHAGLVARSWSAEYRVNERNNIAGAVAGSVLGGMYMRRVGVWWVGGVAGVADGRGQVSALAALSW